MTIYELHPGQVALGRSGDVLRTLLGSCVSVILTDPRHTVGAMCHIVHTGHPSASNRGNTAWGSEAMAELSRLLYGVGFAPRSCQAYVYGGGNMFPQLFTHHHVGASNADWVLGYLDHHKIPIVAQDLCGVGYRRLTWTVGPEAPQVKTDTN